MVEAQGTACVQRVEPEEARCVSQFIRADANGVRVVKDLELTVEVRRMVELWAVCAEVREHSVRSYSGKERVGQVIVEEIARSGLVSMEGRAYWVSDLRFD